MNGLSSCPPHSRSFSSFFATTAATKGARQLNSLLAYFTSNCLSLARSPEVRPLWPPEVVLQTIGSCSGAIGTNGQTRIKEDRVRMYVGILNITQREPEPLATLLNPSNLSELADSLLINPTFILISFRARCCSERARSE